MKITRIETIICSAFDGYTWVQIHTDDGLIGLGETNSGHDAVTGYVHEEAAQFLLGQDPIAIERHYATLSRVNHLGGMGHRGLAQRCAVFRPSTSPSGTYSDRAWGCRSTDCWAGRCATESSSTTHAPVM